MPRVFAEPVVLDTLAGHVAWTQAGDRVEVSSTTSRSRTPMRPEASFGSYRGAPQGAGEIDLTGSLSRADARSVARYMPITVMKNSRPWLERAFVAGQSNDVRFRMKGRLEDFPFPRTTSAAPFR